MRIFGASAVIYLVLSTITGCAFFSGSGPGDDHLLSEKTTYRTDYAKEALYILRTPAFLMRWPANYQSILLPRFEIIPKNADDGPPQSIEENRQYVAAVLPPGTKIRFREMRIISNPVMGISVYPLVIIENERLGVVGLVNCRSISKNIPSDTPTEMIESTFLEIASSDAKPGS